MSKSIIVVNGAGGVGKDTLCNFYNASCGYRIISSVDLVKIAGKMLGWDGHSKSKKDRKFLADLKDLSSKAYDGPLSYEKKETANFIGDRGIDVLFVMIREPEEIEKYVGWVLKTYHFAPATVLVKRFGVSGIEDGQGYGNHADDGVESYTYDYIFDNNGSIPDGLKRFSELINNIRHEDRFSFRW